MKSFLSVLFFLSPLSFAIDQIVITAERASSLSVGNSMTSSMIITQEDIKAKQYETVYQVLRDVPGVDVVATAPGQTATIFIRGEKSEQTLVLIDGVEFNDPTDPGRGVDLGTLSMDGVDRIEIIRGAQSVLYPGVGGVINIITRSGLVGDSQTRVSVEGGSFGTFRSNISTRGKTKESFDYSLAAGTFNTDGISSVPGGAELDGSKSTTFSGKFGKQFSPSTRAELITRYYESKTDLDLPPVDVANFQASQQNLLIRLQGKTKVGIWEPTLGFGFRSIDRNSLNYGSNPNTHFNSTGNISKIDLINRFFLSDSHQVTWGLETDRQQAKIQSNYGFGPAGTDRHVNQLATFLQYDHIQDEGFYLTTGGRIDYHTNFGWQPTFKMSPGYKIKSFGTTIRSAIGTGFKAPSIYQLYGEYGTSTLKPEKAVSVDLGGEQTLFDNRSILIVTAFYNKLTDMVDFNTSANRFVTIGMAHTKGVEVSQATRLWTFLKWSTSYTFMETKDDLTNLPLLRRPKNKLSNSLVFSSGEIEASLTHLLIGLRPDLDSVTFLRKEMASFNLFNICLSYQIFQNTLITGRVENLFNTHYQALDGYSSPGISFYAGIKQTL